MRSVTIPDILELDFNKQLKLFNYFSLGEVVNKDLFNSKKTQYGISVVFHKDPLSFATEDLSDFSSFYKVGKTSVYLERKYSGITCKMLVRNIDKDHFEIIANNAYYNTIRFKIDNLYPIGVHATDILLLKMLRDDNLVLHGASLSADTKKNGFAIVAPPDTGKTYTTYKLLEKGYKFLGEDLSYYSHKDDSLYCMPYTSTWGHHFSKNRNPVDKIPVVQLFVDQNKKTVDDFFGDKSVRTKAKLDRIYLIEKDAKESIKKLTADDKIVDQLMSIQRNEFTYFKNPLIRAYEYFNITKIDDIFAKERQNFAKLLKKKEIIKVTAPNHEGFYEQIHEYESTR